MNQDDLNKLLKRIDNWVRWGKPNDSPRGRCASIEGRYVAPRPDDQKAEAAAQLPVDVRDAEVLEDAVRRIPNPDYQALIRGKYVNRTPISLLCKSLNVRTHLFDIVHRAALDEMAYRIRYEEHRIALANRKSRRYNSKQMTDLARNSLPVGSLDASGDIPKAA